MTAHTCTNTNAIAEANVTFGTAVHPYDDGNPMHAHEFAPGHHPQVRSGWVSATTML